MDNFTLLIGGQSMDTGRYGHLPKADEIIRDPGKAIALKMSRMPRTRRYVARACPFLLRLSGDADLQYARLHIKRHGFPAYSQGELESSLYGRYCIAGPRENALALKAAANARKAYSRFSLDKRFDIFRSFVERVIQHRPLITEASVAEGHPLKMVNWEFQQFIEGQAASRETEDFLRAYVFEPYPLTDKEYLVRQPLGAFGVTTPYNAAVVLGLLSIGSAIISGNTLVVKPSLSTPVSTLILAGLLQEALDEHGAPEGCINVVIGDAKRIVDQWIASPLLDGLVIYASSELGATIGSRAVLEHKKPILELAGSDATLVWNDADLERASEDIVRSRFVGSGQFCAATKRLFVHAEVHDELVALLVKKAQRLKLGLPSDPDTDLAAIGSLSALRSLTAVLDEALAHGAELALGGNRVNYKGERDVLGLYLEPTIVTHVDPRLSIMQEELFGPILPVTRVQEIDEAIELVNDSRYGLRASLWATDGDVKRKFIEEVRVGGVIVNDDHLYFGPRTPNLGGVKASGIIGTKYFAQEMTYLKYVRLG